MINRSDRLRRLRGSLLASRWRARAREIAFLEAALNIVVHRARVAQNRAFEVPDVARSSVVKIVEKLITFEL